MLTCLQENGLRVKKEKCIFHANFIEFLGHKIDAEGVQPTTDKLKAIKEASRPKNKQELQAFLGLLSFYSAFLKNRATVV